MTHRISELKYSCSYRAEVGDHIAAGNTLFFEAGLLKHNPAAPPSGQTLEQALTSMMGTDTVSSVTYKVQL